MTLKFFDNEYDTLTWNGKEYEIKENMYLQFRKWNQIKEEYYYFNVRGLDKISNVLEMSQIFDMKVNFEILYDEE